MYICMQCVYILRVYSIRFAYDHFLWVHNHQLSQGFVYQV